MKHGRTRPRVFGWKLLFVALAALLSTLTHRPFDESGPTVTVESLEPYPMFERRAEPRAIPREAIISDVADPRKRERL